MKDRRPPTRRAFLQVGAVGVAAAGLPAPLWAQGQIVPLDQYKTEFLTSVEWAFIMAATARIIPSEGDGPGAIEAGVPVFIDRDLAGPYGASSTYRILVKKNPTPLVTRP